MTDSKHGVKRDGAGIPKGTTKENKKVYKTFSVSWSEYQAESRKRLGIEKRDVSEQLSAARFFIMNHKELISKKFDPAGNKRDDIEINKDKFYINKVEAVNVSDKIPESDKARIEKYLNQIFDVMKRGFEPAIVECYDEKEAKVLPKLHDKYRQRK